jgi:hypothetical protein
MCPHFKGILSRFGLPSHSEEKILWVGLSNLLKDPVFHLKNNQANLFAEEQKIRFVSIDIRRLPAEVMCIRLSHPLEEPVEDLLTFCLKLLDITGYHHRHCVPPNKSRYALIRKKGISKLGPGTEMTLFDLNLNPIP